MTFSAPLLVPAIRLDHEDAEDQAARALRQAAAPWLAGFCLFGGEAAQVRGLTTRLRETAHRPIFIASDMERGAGQQVEGLAVLPEAGVWGRAATPEEVFAYGEQTARDAVSVGVDVIFAPVLDVRSECDNPIVGNRSFGWDPFRVTHLGAAFARGVLRGGALPVAKHYPGHGPTTTDSHDAVPVVRTSRRRLVSRDLAPFHALVAADVCPAVMTAHVAYPALDPSGVVATFSRPILDALRSAAGDEANVAIVTDALGMEGACAGIGETEAARRALLAGCDLLLYPRDADAVAAALEAPTEVTDAATSRVRAFLGRLALVAAEAAGKAGPAAGEDAAARVAARAVDMGWQGGAESEWVLVLDDDDVESRGRLLAEAGRRARVPVTVLRIPRGERPAPEPPVQGGWTVVVMASIRAWKGAAGLSPQGGAVLEGLREAARTSGRRLRVVWCGPSPAPGEIHVPGCGRHVERALATRLFRAAP